MNLFLVLLGLLSPELKRVVVSMKKFMTQITDRCKVKAMCLIISFSVMINFSLFLAQDAILGFDFRQSSFFDSIFYSIFYSITCAITFWITYVIFYLLFSLIHFSAGTRTIFFICEFAFFTFVIHSIICLSFSRLPETFALLTSQLFCMCCLHASFVGSFSGCFSVFRSPIFCFTGFTLIMKSIFCGFIVAELRQRFNYFAVRALFGYDYLRHGSFSFAKRLCLEPVGSYILPIGLSYYARGFFACQGEYSWQ